MAPTRRPNGAAATAQVRFKPSTRHGFPAGVAGSGRRRPRHAGDLPFQATPVAAVAFAGLPLLLVAGHYWNRSGQATAQRCPIFLQPSQSGRQRRVGLQVEWHNPPPYPLPPDRPLNLHESPTTRHQFLLRSWRLMFLLLIFVGPRGVFCQTGTLQDTHIRPPPLGGGVGVVATGPSTQGSSVVKMPACPEDNHSQKFLLTTSQGDSAPGVL